MWNTYISKLALNSMNMSILTSETEEGQIDGHLSLNSRLGNLEMFVCYQS